MTALRTTLSAFVLLAVTPGAAALRADDPVKLPPAERAAITIKLKAKPVATRVDAIKRLSAFDDAEAIRMLVRYGLGDASDEVRRTAYDALLKSKDRHDACDVLIEQLNALARIGRYDATAPLILCVLLSSEIPDIQKASLRYVDQTLALAKDGPAFVIVLADALASRHEAVDVKPLVRLTESNLFKTFAVKRAVVRALMQIDAKEAIDALVGMFPDLEGEVRADVLVYLIIVTRQKLLDPAAWTEWWKANKEAFQFPKPFARPQTRTFDGFVSGGTPSYYGLPLFAQRLVFVLDASGSMTGPRLAAAKRQLTSAVQELGDTVQFAIVVYNSDVAYWKQQLVTASTENKLEAVKFVEQIEAGGRTATYDALQAAFYFDAEAMYLLTDGAPSAGKIVAHNEIVSAITLQNKTRRESIYTIGIGPGPAGSPFDVFLRKLGEDNYGQYKRVDE
jgi:hypothetical protein